MTRTIKKSLSAAAHAERLYQGRVAAMNAAASPPASALSSASPPRLSSASPPASALSSASPLSEVWLDGSPARKSPTETRKKASPKKKKKKKKAAAAAAAATRRRKSSSSVTASSSRKRKASPAIQQHSDRAAQRIAGLPSPQRKALLARLAAFKARSHSPSQSPPSRPARMRLGTAEPSPAPYPSSSSPAAAKGTELSVTGVTQQFDRARTAVQTQQHAKKVAATAAAAAKTTKVFVKGYDYVAATDQVYTVSAVRPHPDAIEHYVVLTNYKNKTQTHKIDVQYDEDAAGYTITVDGKTYAHTPLFKSENDTTPLKQPLHKMKQGLREQTLRNFVLYHIKHA